MTDVLALNQQLANTDSLKGQSAQLPPAQWAALLNAHFKADKSTKASFIAGFHAHCVGYAFTAGYQNAVHTQFPSPDDALVSFSISEKGSTHPSNIRTVLNTDTNRLTGTKHFVAMAEDAQMIFVLAALEPNPNPDSGRRTCRIIKVPVDLDGVSVTPSAPLPVMPDIHHGVAQFDNALIEPDLILSGDAYDDFAKPFSRLEIVHICSALLGYFYGALLGTSIDTFLENENSAKQLNQPNEIQPQILSLLAEFSQLANTDLMATDNHTKLGHCLDQLDKLVIDIEKQWQQDESELGAKRYQDWLRDKALLMMYKQGRQKQNAKPSNS